jgi:hypothetical protein
MVMEHVEALERIETAAAEPDGLDRLMAGDTADAAAIAGHLAGCPACVGEMARIRRTASIARDIIRTQPDPALRARTLAYVLAAGVPRGAAGSPADAGPAGGVPAAGGVAAVPAPASDDAARDRRRPGRLAWIAAAAAVAIVALGIGYLAGAPSREQLDSATRQAALLARTAEATLRVQAQPDATRISLVATAEAPDAEGTLLYSPSSGELVMVATDLDPAPPAQEYGCWVEADDTRERIGRMYRAGELWTWAGPVDGLDDLPPDAVFGVSIGPVGGAPDSVVVLTGGR